MTPPTPKPGMVELAERADPEQLIKDMAGALNFVLAFYEPGQRYLDTNAWAQACGSAVRSFNAANTYLGSPWTEWVANNGTVYPARAAAKGEGE